MDFFSDCQTKEQAKARFRQLGKLFHPDKSGDNDFMRSLQEQYDSWKPNDDNYYRRQDRLRPNSFGFGSGRMFRYIDNSDYLSENEQLKRQNQTLNEICKRKDEEIAQHIDKYTKLMAVCEGLRSTNFDLGVEINRITSMYPKTIWEYLKKRWEK